MRSVARKLNLIVSWNDKKSIFCIILLFVDKNTFLVLIEAEKISKFFFLENRIETVTGITNVV